MIAWTSLTSEVFAKCTQVIPSDGGGKVATAAIHEMGAILDANDTPYEIIDEVLAALPTNSISLALSHRYLVTFLANSAGRRREPASAPCHISIALSPSGSLSLSRLGGWT